MSPRSFEDSHRPFVWIRSRISPSESAGPQAFSESCTGMCPYGICAVRDPLRADHARVADVDHRAVRLDVETDAKPGQEDGCAGEHPVRPEGPRGSFRLAAKAEPQHPAEEPRQRRIRERHAGEDVAVVEEPQRDGEREQHEQVDVPQPKRPAPVEEPDQEDRAEREPDDGPVERLAAERARAASRHLPRDLWAGPRLVDAAGRVVDLAEGDLAGLARPDTDGPVARRALELGVGGGLRRVAVEPGRDLRVGEEEPRHARLGQPRPARSRRERRVDEAALLVVDRGGRPGRRPGRRRRGRPGPRRRPRPPAGDDSAAEGPELVADEVQRGDEHDRDRLGDDLPDATPGSGSGARPGSPAARRSRRRGSASPGRRGARGRRGTSRSGSAGSCSSRRRGTSRWRRAGSAGRRLRSSAV